jgi:hypothetical protein
MSIFIEKAVKSFVITLLIYRIMYLIAGFIQQLSTSLLTQLFDNLIFLNIGYLLV